jgi:hypothetical protein
LISRSTVVEISTDPDDDYIRYYYSYCPFQTFSEKLPYVPPYLK